MTAKEILELLQIQGIGGLALSVTLIILSAIQIAPVKWNPWTKILGWLGKQINQDLSAKIDGIESKLDSHIEKYTAQRADDIRNTILVFANECSRGIVHSKEQFRFIVSKCDAYEQYVEDNHLKNGVITEATKLIKDTYQSHLKNDSFLK